MREDTSRTGRPRRVPRPGRTSAGEPPGAARARHPVFGVSKRRGDRKWATQSRPRRKLRRPALSRVLAVTCQSASATGRGWRLRDLPTLLPSGGKRRIFHRPGKGACSWGWDAGSALLLPAAGDGKPCPGHGFPSADWPPSGRTVVLGQTCPFPSHPLDFSFKPPAWSLPVSPASRV